MISLADLTEAMNQVLASDVCLHPAVENRELASVPLRHLNFDSLAILELGILLEERWGLSINPSRFPLTTEATVNDLLIFLNTLSGVHEE